MRFIANGPAIPDELLVARDKGDVIFFCGAGVSQAKARLPSFEALGREVLRSLGSALDSPARRLFDKALQVNRTAGVGGLSTDRVFGLLEREFETADVRIAVAQALRPPVGHELDAHKIMLDLATTRAGVTRLVTTNFDLLFEQCNGALLSSGPPHLPDPRSERDFQGIIHLHGRVDPDYRGPQDDEFVVSSADFGRAYLSDGWATNFIRSLLSRFQIVFVGYTADDPPVQYLLEALNLHAGTKSRLFAFQEGESGAAAALWEHKGVQAIPFDGKNDFAALWETLRTWAERSRDVGGWHARLLSAASPGPTVLEEHVRGQVAHVFSSPEGARRALLAETLDASWILAFDPKCRYDTPCLSSPYDETSEVVDPFVSLCLDIDAQPEAADPEQAVGLRALFRPRKAPEDAWDAFAPNRLDKDKNSQADLGHIRGDPSGLFKSLPPRLASLGVWIQRVAHQPVILWWAAGQTSLHPAIVRHIESSLVQDAQRFPTDVRKGWRFLLAAWTDERSAPDMLHYQIQARARQDGWTETLVREYIGIYRPRLAVRQAHGIPHPLTWKNGAIPDRVLHVDVEYPRPHEDLEIPDDQLAYAVVQFRGNLELAISLEREVTGHDVLHFETSRANDGEPDLPNDSFGLTGPIVHFQKMIRRFAQLDPKAAREEALAWPSNDRYVFARLRIWAAGSAIISAEDAGLIFCGLPDSVFWNHVHDRDLLYALRDRWADLTAGVRIELEDRLVNDSSVVSDQDDADDSSADAFERASKLHWLSSQGVMFGFDVQKAIADLRSKAPQWTTEAGNAAANSHAPVVHDVTRNEDADVLLETPLADILQAAHEAGRYDFTRHVQREPFRGLSTRRPSRALGALTHAARQGLAPHWAWSEFLQADGRAADSDRMIAVILARLANLPQNVLIEVARSIVDWMESVADRLYRDPRLGLNGLWNQLVASLAADTDEPRPRRRDRSWADEALNAPVGKLVNLLMKDPAKDGLQRGATFPSHWTTRVSQLLELPGDLRRQALVMTAFQTNWLYTIDPPWAERYLLPATNDAGADGDAFWDGVLWAARLPSPELLLKLKPGLIIQALRPRSRRGHDTTLAGLLLAGWGGAKDAEPGQLVTDIELRETLIHADDGLRGRLIWQLSKWSEDDKFWRGLVTRFLNDVWPKQRALRTPALSARLVEFAMTSGDLMPLVVELLLPRLVPTRGVIFGVLQTKANSSEYPPRRYPRATLDLLWAILAEEPADWPFGIEELLAALEQESETNADPRLSELRRRRER